MANLLDDFSLSRWGRDDGMTEVEIREVGQSPDGFIWCLTPNHLLFFDGLRFEVRGQIDSDAAKDPYPIFFRGWAVDGSGTPWIFGQRGAIWRTEGGWHRLDTQRTSPQFIAMLPDSNHNFWALTSGNLWRVENGRVSPVSNQPLSTTPRGFTSAVADVDGSLVIGSQSGLYRFRDNIFTRITADNTGSPLGVSCFQLAQSNEWWVCCQEGLLHRRNADWEQLALPFQASQAVALLRDAEGGIWVGTKQGLFRYSSGRWSEMSARDVGNPINVLSLATDRQNHVWVGTSDGLFCLRSKLVRTLVSNAHTGRQTITSLASTDRTNVIAGSLNDGLLLVGKKELTPLKHLGLPPGIMISALGVDKMGDLWVGSLGNHLFHLGVEGCTTFTEASKSPYSAQDISAILNADTNQVWIGTWQGLFQMTNAALTGKTVALLQPVGMKNTESKNLSPVANRVTSLFADTDGSLWIGYDGLWVLRRDVDSMKEVYGYGWGLPSPNVRTFYRDPLGRIWAGTSQGLGLLAQPEWQDELKHNQLFLEDLKQRTHNRNIWQYTLGKKLLWESASTTQGLTEADIRQIIEDDYGRIWLGTRKGIDIVDRHSLESVMSGRQSFIEGRHIGAGDGMVSEECTLNSSPGVIKDSTGRLYFATTDGLVVADPAQIDLATNLAKVYVQRVVADNQVIFHRDENFPVSLPGEISSALPRLPISLPLGLRDVLFDFATPVYDAPARMRFRWRLDGVDKDWSTPSVERQAKYPRLAPGDYTFHVIMGRQDLGGQMETTFKFRIVPFFYERPVLQATGGLVLTAVITMVVWNFERWRGRRRMLQLERERALERERTRISRDLHDELGVGLTEIGLLGDLAAAPKIEPESTNELAGEISTRARSLVTALDEIVWAVNPANDNSLSLSDYLSRYGQTLLQRAGLRCQIDVTAVSRDIGINAELRHQLFFAFKEALNNVITHADAKEVRIGIFMKQGQLEIYVADDGHGLGSSEIKGSQDGLRGLRERLAEIGGTCEIQSVPGRGTTVTFKLPLETETKL